MKMKIFLVFYLIFITVQAYYELEDQAVNPVGGTLFLSNNLPPFMAGNHTEHLIFSGFGQSIYFSGNTGHSYAILRENETRCNGENLNLYPRLFHSPDHDLYYYCSSEHKIYVFKSDLGLDYSDATIDIPNSPQFETSKFIFAHGHFALLGQSNKTGESYLVYLSIEGDEFLQITKLTGQHGEPISDLIFLNKSHFVALGAPKSNELEVLNLYLGEAGKSSLNKVLTTTKGSKSYLTRLELSADGEHFLYTSLDEGTANLFAYHLKTGNSFKVATLSIINNSFKSEKQVHEWTESYFAVMAATNLIYTYHNGFLACHKLVGDEAEFVLYVELPLVSKNIKSFRGWNLAKWSHDELWMQFDDVSLSVVAGFQAKIDSVSPSKETWKGYYTWQGHFLAIGTQGIFRTDPEDNTAQHYFNVLSHSRDGYNEEIFFLLGKDCKISSYNIKTHELKPIKDLSSQGCSLKTHIEGFYSEDKLNLAVLDEESGKAYLFCGDSNYEIPQDFRQIEPISSTLRRAGQIELFPSCTESPSLVIVGNSRVNDTCSRVYRIEAFTSDEEPKVSYLTRLGARITRQHSEGLILNEYDVLNPDRVYYVNPYTQSSSVFEDMFYLWSFLQRTYGFFERDDGTFTVYVYQNKPGFFNVLLQTPVGLLEFPVMENEQEGIDVEETLLLGSYKERKVIVAQETVYSVSLFVFEIGGNIGIFK